MQQNRGISRGSSGSSRVCSRLTRFSAPMPPRKGQGSAASDLIADCFSGGSCTNVPVLDPSHDSPIPPLPASKGLRVARRGLGWQSTPRWMMMDVC